MIKRLFAIALFSSLLPGLAAHAEPVNVRIQLINNKEYSGVVSARESGSLIFLPFGSEQPVRIPDEQVTSIKLPLASADEQEVSILFENGQYREASEKLSALLEPYRDYITLPSNLSPLFLQWLAASYWTGESDRTLALAASLSGVVSPELQKTILFYGGLARFDKGDFQGMETFLNSPAAATTYPPESAARLFIDARMLQHQQKYIPAIRTAALLMARHSRDADWMPKAELLCAEIYFQLEMPESAKAALADIKEFYSDPEIQQQAAAIAAGK